MRPEHNLHGNNDCSAFDFLRNLFGPGHGPLAVFSCGSDWRHHHRRQPGLEITTRLNRNPILYLLAVAMSSNIGSVATITGNPQNRLIGTFSQIPYRLFALKLAPVAVMGLLLTVLVIFLAYRREFLRQPRVEIENPRVRINKVLLWKVKQSDWNFFWPRKNTD